MALIELLARIDGRLRELGISERKACISGGLKVDAVRTIRRGHPPTLGKLTRLAKVLDVPLAYLTDAATDFRLDQVEDNIGVASPEGLARQISASPDNALVGTKWRIVDATPPPGYVVIGRAVVDADGEEFTVLIPETLIRVELGGAPKDFLLARIQGSTMSPDLEHGDRVIVDCRRRIPAEPGLFLIDEGMGPVARWVQFIPGSYPPRYRVSSKSLRFDAYEISASGAKIIGRLVWHGRRV